MVPDCSEMPPPPGECDMFHSSQCIDATAFAADTNEVLGELFDYGYHFTSILSNF